MIDRDTAKFGPMMMLAVCLFGATAAAQEVQGPFLHPESGSYFEVRNVGVVQPVNWGEARRLAARSAYRGIRGRLAVVDSALKNNFLRSRFEISSEAWIGLRYWCKFRKLQWITGDLHSRQQFNNWAPKWYRIKSTGCESGTVTQQLGYMPVYYLPNKLGFWWQASGAAKKFQYYIIEYPAE